MDDIKQRICPRCGKSYTEPPVVSRLDNSLICSMCGYREALSNAVSCGIMTLRTADEILEKIMEGEREQRSE